MWKINGKLTADEAERFLSEVGKMIREALDEKYSYQIDEHGMVHLFRGEEDCRQYLTNPLLSAIFKIEALKKENTELKEQIEQMKCCGNCQSVFDANGFCYLYKDGKCVDLGGRGIVKKKKVKKEKNGVNYERQL